MTWLALLMLLPAAAAMLFSPVSRLFLVTAAGLVVFTPGQADLTTKVAFVALVLASTTISLLRLRSAHLVADRAVITSAAAYGASLMVAALVGWTDDVPATLQNGLPYVLPLLLLPIAIDAGRGTRRQLIEAGMLAVGLLSAVSFMIFWLDRRHVSAVAINQVLGSSILMPALVFQWGIVTSLMASRTWTVRLTAMSSAVFIAAAFLLTGTRTSLVLAAGLFALVIGRSSVGKIFKTVLALSVAGAVAIPLLDSLASVFLTRPDFVSSRISSLASVLQYGSAADASWQARQLSTQAAQIALEGHWLFGTGLSTPQPLINFDTPLSIVMRVGLLGSASAVAFIVTTLRYAMRGGTLSGSTNPVRAVLLGWFLIVAGLSAIIPPFDDPLFAFAFAIAVALGINAQGSNVPQTRGPTPDSRTRKYQPIPPPLLRTPSVAGLSHPDGAVRQIVDS